MTNMDTVSEIDKGRRGVKRKYRRDLRVRKQGTRKNKMERERQ